MSYHIPTASQWQPSELGFVRSSGGAVVAFVAIVAVIALLAPSTPHKPPVTVTQARMVTLPPPPPPPPEIVQPPEPLQPPPIKPPEAEAPSRVEVKKPPPKPIHHVVKRPPPIHHEEPRPETPPPPPNTPVARAPQPPAPIADHSSGIGPYTRGLHSKIEANVEVPPAIAQLGLSGTATIGFVISPGGAVSGIHVARSSGNSLIDKAAMDAVRHTAYSAFTSNMPTSPQAFVVPIEITGNGGE